MEEPQVYGDKVKIKVAFTGICGSDIHTFKGEYKNPTTPVTLGHEFSGVVVEVGPDVTSIKVETVSQVKQLLKLVESVFIVRNMITIYVAIVAALVRKQMVVLQNLFYLARKVAMC